MADSVYKVIELVGTSTESWEKAARSAVERASQSLRDLRVAEVLELDMQITENSKVSSSCNVMADRLISGSSVCCR
jgi:dodecin